MDSTSKFIRRNWKTLVKNIKPDEIINHLMQEDDMELQSLDELLHVPRGKPTAWAVLSYLMKSKHMSISRLLDILEQCKTPRRVMDFLRNFTEDGGKVAMSSDEEMEDEAETNGDNKVSMKIGTVHIQNSALNEVTFGHMKGIHQQKVKNARGEKRKREEADNEKMSQQDAYKILETMENTMLHDPECRGARKFPRVTYGMFQVQGGESSPFFERELDSHVEVKVAETLERWILQGKLRGPHTVTVYVNWSPCLPCADRLLNFLEWSQQGESPLRLVLKCVALCKVTWPACTTQKCSHLNFAHQDDACRNGIVKLMQGGVEVEAFEPADWGVLKQALGLPVQESPRSKSRKSTDDMMRRSLRALKRQICKGED